MRSAAFVLFAFFLVASANVVDKVAQQTEDAVNKAQSGKARQCTCDEQHECVIELEAHGKECSDQCFKEFSKISKDPEQLRECFNNVQITMASLITCMEDEATTCAKEKTDKQVDRVDIEKLINVGTKKLLNAGKNLSQLFSGEVKEVLGTVEDFGICIKNCVKEKNKDGFCFDKKECQPLLDEKEEAKKAVKKCTKEVDFKKHAAEVCSCAAKTGIKGLDKLCPVIKNTAEGVQDAIKGSH